MQLNVFLSHHTLHYTYRYGKKKFAVECVFEAEESADAHKGLTLLSKRETWARLSSAVDDATLSVLRCVRCHKLPREPLITDKCGHFYCRDCWKSVHDSQRKERYFSGLRGVNMGAKSSTKVMDHIACIVPRCGKTTRANTIRPPLSDACSAHVASEAGSGAAGAANANPSVRLTGATLAKVTMDFQSVEMSVPLGDDDIGAQTYTLTSRAENSGVDIFERRVSIPVSFDAAFQ